MTAQAPVAGRRVLYGVALICFANLMLEVVLTRIFSATMYYHFTFLAIALALFGLGASGVYVYVRSERFTPETLPADLARNARRFAATTVLALIYCLANPIDIVIVTGTNQIPVFTSRTVLQLILLNGTAALPFFFAGMVVALAVSHYRAQIDRLYFYDLCGAGMAALLAGTMLGIFGGPSLLIVVGVLALVGAALFQAPKTTLGWAPLAAMLALLVVNLVKPVIAVPTVKGVRADRTVFERWNVFSRVTVEQMKGEMMIKIDNSAATQVTPASVASSPRWKTEISAIAYAIFPGGPENSLIIGPGGGRDVAHALGAGTRRVTGVEVNPIIAKVIMQDKFLKESEGLYKDARVRIVVDDGRSFVRRSREHYDVIQASLVDTWAATAAGAFALTENTLYTMEAFADYYQHLSDNGVLTMTRWYTGDHGETARLVVLAAGALEKRGIAPGATRRHLVLVQHGSLGTLIAKRTEFTADELARLGAAVNAAGFQIVLSPSVGDGTGLADMVDNGAWSTAVTSRAEDLRPPTDDRPFFFYFVKPGTLLRRIGNLQGTSMADAAVWILIAAGASVAAFALAFILLPLLLHKRGVLTAGSGRDRRRRLVALTYFALIGLAFMVVEMALMQKFALFLGHPSYALLVVLFSLLAGTAIGARMSGRLGEKVGGGQLPLIAAGATALLALVYSFVLGPALHDWVAWALPARIALSGVLVGLCGLAMGMLLPSGVKLTARHDAELIPWGWGLNGAASVIGTVGATITAIQVGFRTTLVVGAVLYLLAGGAAILLDRLARAPVAKADDAKPNKKGDNKDDKKDGAKDAAADTAKPEAVRAG